MIDLNTKPFSQVLRIHNELVAELVARAHDFQLKAREALDAGKHDEVDVLLDEADNSIQMASLASDNFEYAYREEIAITEAILSERKPSQHQVSI